MTYSYPISATASGDVDPVSLTTEVNAAQLGATLQGLCIGSPVSQTIDLVFDTALASEPALAAVVAAHNGTSPFAPIPWA